jgi:hypothetical protein
MRVWLYVPCILLPLGIGGCGAPEAPPSAYFSVSTQPPNVGDAKIEALKYHDSGARHRTGRIARFAARTRNILARQPVPIDLDPPDRMQTIDIVTGDFDPNRV